MKKGTFISVVVFLIFVLNACTSLGSLKYPEPSFDKPSVYVIDSTKTNTRIKDYVKLHNFTSESDISFLVYVHHPGTREWLFYGIGTLKDLGDTDTIDSSVGNLKNFRYYAIESKDGNTYQYHFYERNNDLHINILDM